MVHEKHQILYILYEDKYSLLRSIVVEFCYRTGSLVDGNGQFVCYMLGNPNGQKHYRDSQINYFSEFNRMVRSQCRPITTWMEKLDILRKARQLLEKKATVRGLEKAINLNAAKCEQESVWETAQWLIEKQEIDMKFPKFTKKYDRVWRAVKRMIHDLNIPDEYLKLEKWAPSIQEWLKQETNVNVFLECFDADNISPDRIWPSNTREPQGLVILSLAYSEKRNYLYYPIRNRRLFLLEASGIRLEGPPESRI